MFLVNVQEDINTRGGGAPRFNYAEYCLEWSTATTTLEEYVLVPYTSGYGRERFQTYE
jgi:hypothetical protein